MSSPRPYRYRPIIAGGLVIVMVLWAVRTTPLFRRWINDFMMPFMSTEQSVEEGNLRSQSKVALVERILAMQVQLYAQQIELRQRSHLVQENTQLRRLLNVVPPPQHRTVVASVVSREPEKAGRRLRVDRGSDFGVVKGQAVLANGVLLGRILEVSRHSAVVNTLLDPNCNVNVSFPEHPGYGGVLSGVPGTGWRAVPRCNIQYLRTAVYEAGWEVETSRAGIQVPAGLPVGVLTTDDSGAVATSLNHLDMVATVVPYIAEMPFSFVVILVPDTAADTVVELPSVQGEGD